jgi:hypothetical protein
LGDNYGRGDNDKRRGPGRANLAITRFWTRPPVVRAEKAKVTFRDDAAATTEYELWMRENGMFCRSGRLC